MMAGISERPCTYLRGLVCLGEENLEGEEDTDGSCGEEEEGIQGQGAMSAAHRTGLAKLPNVVEWLSHALGEGNRQR